jgi:UDP-GlcNAc:undecaprenyl-phosphate/decaprenyl-phosphate GlcNAc-1-phosphate transferase
MSYFIFFILSIFSLYLTEKLSKFFNYYDFPDGVKIHKNKTPNSAGLAIIPLVILMILVNDFNQKIILSLILFIIVIFIGMIDDIKNIKVKTKLMALLIPIYLFADNVEIVKTLGGYGNISLNLKEFSFIFTLLSIILLVNAYNYIDGLDGLLASNIVITFLTLLILNNSIADILIPLIIFLSIFFLYNINFLKIFPKQFLGDSGSLGLGFLVSILIIIFTQTEKIIHPSIIIWSVAFTVYEFLTINIIRIKQKKNLFKRDLNFIFNKFEKKYSARISLLICTIVHLQFCIVAIILNFYNAHTLSLFLFLFLFIVYLYLRLYKMRLYD